MSEHRHIDATTTRCTDCGTYCTVDRPCYCCLAAEVDDLKARLISALAPAEPSYEELQAQVQRVRELHHPIPGFNGSQWCGAHCEATADGDPTYYPCETIRALDLLPPLIDPDCRDGKKHSSCVGGPCQCPCHELAMRG